MFIVSYFRRFQRNNMVHKTIIKIFYFSKNNVKTKTFFIQILNYIKIFINKTIFVMKKEINLHIKILSK